MIRPHYCSSQFLEEIILFVGALSRGEKSNAIGTILFFDFLEPGSNLIEGFIPGDFLKLPALLDQRLCQSIAAIDEFMKIPALDAEPSLIDRIRFARQRSDQLSIQNLQIETAPAPAITTSR
jgi:hypothetical protein